MDIPVYQIYTVLEVYRTQLIENIFQERQNISDNGLSINKNNMPSVFGNRQTLINKVAEDIVERLIAVLECKQKINLLPVPYRHPVMEKKRAKNQAFVFNKVDEKNNKVKTTLLIESSDFLLKRFEQLAKETSG